MVLQYQLDIAPRHSSYNILVAHASQGYLKHSQAELQYDAIAPHRDTVNPTGILFTVSSLMYAQVWFQIHQAFS